MTTEKQNKNNNYSKGKITIFKKHRHYPIYNGKYMERIGSTEKNDFTLNFTLKLGSKENHCKNKHSHILTSI